MRTLLLQLRVNPVAKFESFVERLMERTLTRSSRSRLQPVEIGKRLARVMDADQVVGPTGVRVPNIFDVELSSIDFNQFRPIQSSVIQELETYLARVARDRLFVMASRPIVRLHASDDFKPGEFAVRAQMEDIEPMPAPRSAEAQQVAAAAVPQYTRAMPAVAPDPMPAPRHHASYLVAHGRSFRLERGPISIGRSPDNDIALDDRRISRRHADLSQIEGRWVVHDLGSTNGTAVNGRIVRQAPLRDGDRVSLGGFEVVFQE